MRRLALLAAITLLLAALLSGAWWVAAMAAQRLPIPSPRPLPPAGANTAAPTLPHPNPIHTTWASWAMPLPVQDVLEHEGLLWAATAGGLVVWELDTAESAHFRVEHGLPSHQLTSLAADAAGQLWVGTADAGLGRYDGHTWHTYTARAGGLPSNTIHDLALTPAGELWAATEAGLSQYDPIRDEWRPSGRTLWQLRPQPIRALLPTPEGWWLATPHGVEQYDGRTWRTFTTADGLPSDDITSLARTSEGIWAGTAAGLAWWDGATWQAIPDLSQPILALATAGDGALWVGQAQRAVRLANGAAVAQLFPVAGGTLLADVGGLWPTAEGVWLASRSGVHHLAATGQWRTLPLPAAPAPARHMVWSDGETWLATAEGAYQFSGTGWSYLPSLHGRPTFQLTALGGDGQGGLMAFFNTPAQGWLWRPAGGDWQPAHCQTGAEGRIYGSTVRHVDGSWLVGHDGLFHITPLPSAGVWTCTFLTAEGYLPPAQTAVLGETLYFLQEGVVWQATTEGGLIPLPNAPSTRWQAVAAGQDGVLWLANATSLGRFDGVAWVVAPLAVGTAEVRGMVVGQGGQVWLATAEGVVAQAAGRGQWFGTAEGLPSHDVRRVWLAPGGTLWVATAGGLAQRK